MKIIVLAGGLSPERDVSLISGKGICEALRKNGHDAFLLDAFLGLPYDASKLEEVFSLPGGGMEIAKGISTTVPDLNALKAQREDKSDCYFGPNVIALCQMADITFMAMHGTDGENGKIQATFDTLGIKYTGPSSLGCAVSMDKQIAKSIFYASGVPTPIGVSLTPANKGTSLCELGLHLPLVVKPTASGSSIGVYIVRTEAEYWNAIKESFDVAGEKEVIVEPFIKGKEYASGIIAGKALPLVELVPNDGVYDYANKYQAGCTKEICPPVSIDEELQKKIQTACEAAFKALHMDVYARADFIVDDETGEIYCFEMNALPGMTATSLLPFAAKNAGYEYGELCELIIEESLNARYR